MQIDIAPTEIDSNVAIEAPVIGDIGSCVEALVAGRVKKSEEDRRASAQRPLGLRCLHHFLDSPHVRQRFQVSRLPVLRACRREMAAFVCPMGQSQSAERPITQPSAPKIRRASPKAAPSRAPSISREIRIYDDPMEPGGEIWFVSIYAIQYYCYFFTV